MEYFIYLGIFYIGALMTSFYHVIGYRVPMKRSISGRSKCDSCENTLKWVDILPVFGYLIHKGKCRYCQTRIPIQHIIYEILGGLILLLGYLLLGFTLEYLIYFILFSVLMIESISDLYYQIVIDRVWIIGAIFVFLIRVYQEIYIPYIISAALLFLILFLISYVASKIYKKEALGGGDVKLFIFIGLTLTLELGILTLFLASLFGLIYGIIVLRKKDLELPLVPFICIASIISFLFGEMMIESYLSLLGV